MSTERPLRTITIPSSDNATTYTVSRFETFDVCTCEGFKYRKVCRHIHLLDLQNESVPL